MWCRGGRKATGLTPRPATPHTHPPSLVDMLWRHVAAGDLMSGKGLSDQLGASHLQPSTPSVCV